MQERRKTDPCRSQDNCGGHACISASSGQLTTLCSSRSAGRAAQTGADRCWATHAHVPSTVVTVHERANRSPRVHVTSRASDAHRCRCQQHSRSSTGARLRTAPRTASSVAHPPRGAPTAHGRRTSRHLCACASRCESRVGDHAVGVLTWQLFCSVASPLAPCCVCHTPARERIVCPSTVSPHHSAPPCAVAAIRAAVISHSLQLLVSCLCLRPHPPSAKRHTTACLAARSRRHRASPLRDPLAPAPSQRPWVESCLSDHAHRGCQRSQL